ncbi:MAG TPA: anhydro-N-acetylmuramic acid kinase [Thermodesulfobacteriota bacterium]|nr:anhydro-N-acetylmuramic acid kinase [Thermodesulfobacteriota bacterium]
MKRLIEVFDKPARTILGLMSGTSHDGIDAVIAKIIAFGARSKVTIIHHNTYPYPTGLQGRIGRAFNGGTSADICRLNFDLGEAFSDAALKCIKEAGLEKKGVDVIASHGQTVYHIPPIEGAKGSTLQIGEASVIAERTGILTISDFRTRDMAAGGQGAPLVALADHILFQEKGKVRALQNIGGIANVTVVTEKVDDVIAFDTGPGNSLIDEAVRILTDGRESFDMDGRTASAGKVDEVLLKELMNHPYLSMNPPKSTGRELFGKEMAQLLTRLVTGEAGRRKGRKPEDLIATLTMFTARSIYNAYERFIFPRYRVDEVVLSGGGSRNPVLVQHLKDLFEKVGKARPTILFIDELGIPSSAKEALSFAILANETISGNTGNLPKVTGAKKAVVLGKISL